MLSSWGRPSASLLHSRAVPRIPEARGEPASNAPPLCPVPPAGAPRQPGHTGTFPLPPGMSVHPSAEDALLRVGRTESVVM